MKYILIVCLLLPLMLLGQSSFDQAKIICRREFDQSQTIFQALLKDPSNLKSK
jgi:hypothetical protein